MIVSITKKIIWWEDNEHLDSCYLFVWLGSVFFKTEVTFMKINRWTSKTRNPEPHRGKT